eukprot:jgi/Ulvmu1/7074/UM033_0135.1
MAVMKSDGKKRKSNPSKRQKEQKPKKVAKKSKAQPAAVVPPVEDPGSDIELDDDDFAIFEEFGQRVDFLAAAQVGLKTDSAPETAVGKPEKEKKRQDRGAEAKPQTTTDSAEEDADAPASDEEEYEREARSTNEPEQAKGTADLLPFKNRDGELIYDKSKSAVGRLAADSFVPGVSITDDAAGVDENEEDGGSSEDEEEPDDEQPAADAGEQAHATNGRIALQNGASVQVQKRRKADARLEALQEAATFHSKAARREELSQQIAVAASKVMEAPEEQLPALRLLLELALDTDAMVQRLAVLSLSSVFKDVLPGYRVRDATDAEEDGAKLTKAVQALRHFERTLVKAFHSYVKILRSMLRSKASSLNHKRVAVKCLRELLGAVPHFNHMHNVLQALVPAAAGGDERMRRDACAALDALLRGGGPGEVALAAVQLVADLVRQRKCACSPDVLRALLVLQFNDLTKADVEQGSKALERRYKFKKRRLREDAIAAALQEAAVAADADQARLQQSQMLEALFELFFRVLKRCTASGLLRGDGASAAAPLDEAAVREKFPLLCVALEGLGKYTHLIGLEYFTDVIAVFQQLLGSRALPVAIRMRCLLSMADILQAQGDALNVDRKQIYMQLYSALAECPLESVVEEAAAAGGAGDAGGGGAGVAEEGDGREDSCGVLVAKAAARLLGWLKVGDAARLGAFAKRLCSSALHAEPGLAVALTSIAARTVQRHTKLHGMLEGECVGSYGSGGYDPHISDPAEARALSSTLWELCPLLSHYHPAVVQCATAAAAVGTNAAAASVEGALHALEPHVLARRYAYRHSGQMCAVAAKPSGATRGKGAKRGEPAAELSPVIAALAAHCGEAVDVVRECGAGAAAEVGAVRQELAGVFRQTSKDRKRRQKLRKVRVKLYSYAAELAAEAVPGAMPVLPHASAAPSHVVPDATRRRQVTSQHKGSNPKSKKTSKRGSKKRGR